MPVFVWACSLFTPSGCVGLTPVTYKNDTNNLGWSKSLFHIIPSVLHWAYTPIMLVS